MRARREEAAAAHIDLDEFDVRVRAVEIRPDRGLAGMLVDLAIPYVARLIGVVDGSDDLQGVVDHRGAHLRVVKLRGVGDFVERPAVEIDVAQMLRLVDAVVRGVQPVAEDRLAIRVEVAEERVRQGDAPYVAVVMLPRGDALGSLDDGMLPVGRAVDDAFQIADAAAGGIDLFAVDSLMHDDGVPRAGQFGGLRYGGERVVEIARGQVVAIGTDMELESHDVATPLSSTCGNPAAAARPPIIQRYTLRFFKYTLR